MLPLTQLVHSLFGGPSPQPSPDGCRLAGILKIAAGELSSLRLGRRYHYRPFTVAKRDGRERHILAPSPALKDLQRRLLHNYLQGLPIHPAATAFMPGSSVVANARRHAGQSLVATIDLEDFFEATPYHRVRQFFLQQGWGGQALSTLVRLCTYRGSLPQGAPTSPALSNLVNFELDDALSMLARRAGAVYTRYGDDMTFSWRSGEIPAYFEPAVRREVMAAGYRVQPRKDWRVYRAAQQPEITGLVLGRNGSVNPPERVRKQVRKLRWLAWWRRDQETLARLRGYEAYLKTPGMG